MMKTKSEIVANKTLKIAKFNLKTVFTLIKIDRIFHKFYPVCPDFGKKHN